jgi:hypothetical protein
MRREVETGSTHTFNLLRYIIDTYIHTYIHAYQEFMESHTLFLCKNKNARYQAVVSCPNRCGEKMPKKEVFVLI